MFYSDHTLMAWSAFSYIVALQYQVRVQSDPAGRLVISGEPEHADNPWGVTPFKKVCITILAYSLRTEKVRINLFKGMKSLKFE